MDEMDPGHPYGDDGMDEGEGPQGGLATLFAMIMAGLAGQTPHMIRCGGQTGPITLPPVAAIRSAFTSRRAALR